jgi:tetratricopeptide (TPR) repeat protein
MKSRLLFWCFICFFIGAKVLCAQSFPDQSSGGEDFLVVQDLLEQARRQLKTNADSALLIAQRAEGLALSDWPDTLLFRIQKYLGDAYQYSGQFQEALRIYEDCLSFASDSQQATLFKEIGNTQAYLGNYQKAMESFLEALRIKEQEGDLLGMARLTNNIGLLYYRLGNDEYAASYYETTLHYLDQEPDSKIRASVLTNLGYLHARQGDHQKALEVQLQAAQLYKELGEHRFYINSFINTGIEWQELSRFREAAIQYQEAAALARQYGHKTLYADAKNKLATLYILQNDFKKAEPVLKEAYSLAQEIGDPAMLNELNLAYAQYYRGIGRAEEALDFYLQYTDIQDSLLNEANQNRILELERVYQLEKKKLLIQLLEQENAYQHKLIVAFGLALTLFLALSILLFNQLKIRKRLFLQQQQFQQQKTIGLQRELSTVTMQMAMKNDFLMSVQEELKKLRKNLGEQKSLTSLDAKIQQSFQLDADWEQFKIHFDAVHTGYLERLLIQFPLLTQNDQRHCAYIRMNLDTKEISRLMNIHPSSVQRARVRLKKKLNLGREQDLYEFLGRF